MKTKIVEILAKTVIFGVLISALWFFDVFAQVKGPLDLFTITLLYGSGVSVYHLFFKRGGES